MSLRSSPTRYGAIAIAIHWSSAMAVILTWLAGFAVANLEPAGSGAPVLVAHIALGLIVFILTLLRILWWLAADRHPAAIAGQPLWQVRLTQAMHVSLYLLLLLMASSGIATLVLSGAVPTLLAGGPVPDFGRLVPRMAHGLMSRILLVLLAGHVGAALYHQFVRHDRLLGRMGVGQA